MSLLLGWCQALSWVRATLISPCVSAEPIHGICWCNSIWTSLLIRTRLNDFTLLYISQYPEPSLRRNKTTYNLLCYILCTCSQKILQLNTWKLFNDLSFLLDAQCEPLLELIKFSLFFVEVLNQSASSFLHFVQSDLKSNPKRGRVALSLLYLFSLNSILWMPDVMSNELFDLNFPIRL